MNKEPSSTTVTLTLPETGFFKVYRFLPQKLGNPVGLEAVAAIQGMKRKHPLARGCVRGFIG